MLGINCLIHDQWLNLFSIGSHLAVFWLLQAVRLKEENELDIKAQLQQVNVSFELLKTAEVSW